MTKETNGGTTVCTWRDMVLTFSRLPGGWIIATGGKQKERYLYYSMTEVIRKYRALQREAK